MTWFAGSRKMLNSSFTVERKRSDPALHACKTSVHIFFVLNIQAKYESVPSYTCFSSNSLTLVLLYHQAGFLYSLF